MLNSNPILRRELKVFTRDPKIQLIACALTVCLALVLGILWPSDGIYSQVSNDSLRLYAVFLMSNLALIILLVPALTSPAITAERENKSYMLLFTSLLTPGQILRGKLMSGMFMVLMMVMISMPISALCALSGGLSFPLLFKTFSIIVISALVYGLVGLAVSVCCKTTFSSLVISYVVIALLAGTTWIPSFLLDMEPLVKVNYLLKSLSPFQAMWAELYPEAFRYSSLESQGLFALEPFQIFFRANLIIGIIALLIFCRFVGSVPKPGTFSKWAAILASITLLGLLYGEIVLFGKMQEDPRYLKKMFNADYLENHLVYILMGAFVLLLVSFIKRMIIKARAASKVTEDEKTRKLIWPLSIIFRKRRKSINRFMNPVFVADMRSKLIAKPDFLVGGTAFCICASVTLLTLTCMQFSEKLEPDQVRLTAIIFQVAIIAVISPSISSGAITDEVNNHTLLMLRMTPLTPMKIVIGKLKASFVYVSVFLIASLPVLGALTYLDYSQELSLVDSLWRVASWLGILIAVTICFLSAGFAASAFSPSTSIATAISYCFAALICIVPLIALVPDALPDSWILPAMTINPVIAALRITTDTYLSSLPESIWLYNLYVLGSLSLFFIVVSTFRVLYILKQRI
ncbi:MAG: ABC transporter permease subunit [Lentisphaeria bacterium]|nr:ABC transporter permease subunit [Lentisphaeria bacterium]